MLQITCPFCGPRDESEFVFGGPAHVTRPAFEVGDAEWSDYLYIRDNPKGVHFERWCHSYGCGSWFNAARDTVSHESLAVYRMGEAKPALSRSGESAHPDREGSPERGSP